MLHSTQHNKETIEDPKTSSVFENLLLLPDNEFWTILRSACQNSGNLPTDVGLLKEYEFWPKWDPAGTSNPKYVEPDVFLRFKELDVIIEAKVGDFKGQYQTQWDNEFIAYLNEYETEKRKVIHIALGGNSSMKNGQAKDPERHKSTTVYKCSWIALRNEVAKGKENFTNMPNPYDSSAKRRLFENIMLAFSLHNISEIHWFDGLCDNPIEIRQTSINDIKKHFQTRKSWAKN